MACSNEIRIRRFERPEDLIANSFETEWEDIKGHTFAVNSYESDKKQFISGNEYIESIKGVGCFAFCQTRNEPRYMNVWVGPDCDKSQLVFMLAHEYGHYVEPFWGASIVLHILKNAAMRIFRGSIEDEDRADRYAYAARWAYETAGMLLGEKEAP